MIVRRLKDTFKPIVYKIYGSPKERMRKLRHSACLNYLESVSDTRYANYFTEDLIKRHAELMASDKHKTKGVSDRSIIMLKTRFCRTVEFIEKSVKEDINKSEAKVLDVGSVTGSLLRYFGKDGISLNIDPKTIDFLRSAGMETIEGDIHDIPLPDDAVDYSFAFEIIEHIEAPIFALRELGRITKKSIFITIPYLEKTRIRDFGYWDPNEKDRNILESVHHQYHIHEFSVEDIEKIVHQVGLEVVSKEPCFPFKYPRFLMMEIQKTDKRCKR